MREDKLYLMDIAQCIGKIEEYTREGREVFFGTEVIKDAVVRNFEIIGEATKNISQELRQKYPHVQSTTRR